MLHSVENIFSSKQDQRFSISQVCLNIYNDDCGMVLMIHHIRDMRQLIQFIVSAPHFQVDCSV